MEQLMKLIRIVQYSVIQLLCILFKLMIKTYLSTYCYFSTISLVLTTKITKYTLFLSSLHSLIGI